jgi:radical SAM superfamily enzyme YgiQ (UPF0313 family)
MRVVLVDNLMTEHNGTRVEGVLQPHLGLISLLAVVRSAGHEGRLYDPKLAVADGRVALEKGLYRKLAREILEYDPDVVGFTSLGCNFICTLKVAQAVRALEPGVPILLGGPHATILDRAILERYQAFDVIVRHEAENTLLSVLGALDDRTNLTRIPGITFRDGDYVYANPGTPLIECLDTLPMPSYEDHPIERLHIDRLPVEAGRGCPFMCTFCSTASFFGRNYRLKSAARLLLELDELHARYGISCFSLQHDLFTVSREKVLQFCDAVAARGYEWKCSARMDCVDPKLLATMAKSGCNAIFFGVETGSPYLQSVVQKRLDLRLFYPTLDACETVGIRPTVSFITGYPQERTVDQHATLDMVGSCFYRFPPPANVQLHMMCPEPGTELLAQFRDRLAFDGFVSDFAFPPLEPDDSRITAEAPDVFMNSHYFLGELPRRHHVMVVSLYDALNHLSGTVLCYLLDRFEGRLSLLTEAFEAWAQTRDITEVRLENVVDFCRCRFGPHDPATSLVRYMSALLTMPPPLVDPLHEEIGGSDADIYVLNPRARILRDIHYCPALLGRLAALQTARHKSEQALDGPSTAEETRPGEISPPRRGAASPRLLAQQMETDWSRLVQRHEPISPPSDAAPLSDLLVLPSPNTREISNVRLSGSLLSILEVFRQPRSLSGFRHATRERTIPGVIEDLIEVGALIPCRPPARKTMSGAA